MKRIKRGLVNETTVFPNCHQAHLPFQDYWTPCQTSRWIKTGKERVLEWKRERKDRRIGDAFLGLAEQAVNSNDPSFYGPTTLCGPSYAIAPFMHNSTDSYSSSLSYNSTRRINTSAFRYWSKNLQTWPLTIRIFQFWILCEVRGWHETVLTFCNTFGDKLPNFWTHNTPDCKRHWKCSVKKLAELRL